jgi:signal transduction histidine kinase
VVARNDDGAPFAQRFQPLATRAPPVVRPTIAAPIDCTHTHRPADTLVLALLATSERTDLPWVLRDTMREAARSWRLPAALALGIGFGFVERSYTGARAGLVFGVVAALYTLFLGPLPWRVLVPLEEDGRRLHKLVRWAIAAAIGFLLFAALVVPYAWIVDAVYQTPSYLAKRPREFLLSTLLFLVGGWGLARDVQLEQRLDRTIRRQGRLTAELEEARIYAIRADLDPHFLFNALNAIASQCTTDPQGAEDNIVRLASLLRTVLDTRRRALHSLDEELSLARDYLGLLSTRFPSLRYELIEPEQSESIRVPPLLLQPLLENALRHGDHAHGPVIVSAKRDGDRLTLEVRSHGPFRGGRDGGLGLDLVRRRVELAYGGDATFTIETEGDECVARIVAPASPPEPQPPPDRASTPSPLRR